MVNYLFLTWINKLIQNMFRNTRRLDGAKSDGKHLHNLQNQNLCTKQMEFDLSEIVFAWLFNLKIWINKMIQSMCRNTRRFDGGKIDGKPLHNLQNRNRCTKSKKNYISEMIFAWLFNLKLWIKK